MDITTHPPSAEPAAEQLFPLVGGCLRIAAGGAVVKAIMPPAVGRNVRSDTASLCHHCDIGRRSEGRAFDLATNRRRLGMVSVAFHARNWSSLVHLVVYNSGSVLNPAEMPWGFLRDILTMARRPRIGAASISLDSRESFVTTARIVCCKSAAATPRRSMPARVILGIESANDDIRRPGCCKRACQSPRFNGRLTVSPRLPNKSERRRVGIDVNILVGGPGTTPQTAALDAAETASFALEHSRVPVDFNIHPITPARAGGGVSNHPRCSTSAVADAVQAIAAVCESRAAPLRLFIGVFDEGHDTDPERIVG